MIHLSLSLARRSRAKGHFYYYSMEIELTRKPEEIRKRFRALKTRQDLSDLLEVKDKFLAAILYGVEIRKKYRTFQIQKKSKQPRTIHAPPNNLLILQSKVNTILKLVYSPKPCVNGFVDGRNIVDNATQHLKKRHVLNIDLEDFFPSIHIGRVKGAFMSPPFSVPEEPAEVLAQICTLANGVLPQGAPTSPIISNIICRSLDSELTLFAKEIKVTYTRYADDLTFSTSLYRIPEQLFSINNGKVELSRRIVSIIEKHTFKVNLSKVHYSSPLISQRVTGVTVNEFPNIRRSFTRSILGALHAWEKHGYVNAQQKYSGKYLSRSGGGINLSHVLKGKIAFLKMVLDEDSPLFRKTAKRYNACSKAAKIYIIPIEEANSYPLRGKSPKTPWNLWFDRYKDSILFLEPVNNNGDKLTATSFYIGNAIIATALHNLKYNELNVYLGDDLSNIEHRYPDYSATAPDVGIITIPSASTKNLLWLPTQMRLPEIGEEVAAIGYPYLPLRHPTLVMHIGVVEAIPVSYKNLRYIQVSFQSGGGLSGAPLIDKRGFVIGVMAENIYLQPETRHAATNSSRSPTDDSSITPKDICPPNPSNSNVPTRPYGQAIPVEYLSDLLTQFASATAKTSAP